MNIQKFTTEQEFITATIDHITSLSPEKIALSGGNTPRPIYSALKLDATYYQVDERYVPASHDDSNHRMITETLHPEHFHFFDTALAIPDALKKYADELPPQFDLTILGVGPDGHTASLFPYSDALNEDSSPVAHTQTDTFAIHDRLTLTFPPILASNHLLILIKSRPEILAELQKPTKTPQEFPALRLLEHPQLTLHYLE